MLRAIAVDDEKRSRDRLKRIIKPVEGIMLIKSFANAEEALEYLAENRVDLALLDIEMPKMNGIELGDIILHTYENIEIIYITAYNQYAIDAFNVYAIGYLLKPIDKEALQKVVDHAVKKRNTLMHMPEECPITIDLLGKVRCYIEGDSKEVSFRTEKAEELFLFLVHNQGNPVSRNDITDNIWPYMEQKKAVTNFHSTCYYIRDTLKSLGYEAMFLKERGKYKIDMTRIKCDAVTFIRHIDEMNKSTITIKEAEYLYEIYKGRYFENKSYDWVMTKQSWFDRAYEKLMYNMERQYVQQNAYDSAYDILKRIIEYNPLEDEAYIKLIQYYSENQEYLQVVKYYRDYKVMLKSELGIEPADEVRKLVEDYIIEG